MNRLAIIPAIAAAMITARTAQAAVVMTIDISNPSAVVFEATSASASAAYSTITSFQGITMLGLLPGNTATQAIPLDLQGISVNHNDGSSLVSLPDMFVDFYPGGWTSEDFSFYDDLGKTATSGTAPIATFTDKPVAYGFAQHDMTAFTLPSVGHTGNVVIGEAGANLVVGTYEVIPEPTSVALLGLGMLGLAHRRRKA